MEPELRPQSKPKGRKSHSVTPIPIRWWASRRVLQFLNIAGRLLVPPSPFHADGVFCNPIHTGGLPNGDLNRVDPNDGGLNSTSFLSFQEGKAPEPSTKRTITPDSTPDDILHVMKRSRPDPKNLQSAVNCTFDININNELNGDMIFSKLKTNIFLKVSS
ncbi:hypothetical protein JTB14_031411 [Gonioctena quinquepunctata]|nr:hypothetical protein JTB14_031411 [Gonioctena quinquepunctata]